MRTSIISIPHFAQCGRLIDTRYDSDGVKDVIESSPIYFMAEHYRTLSDPGLCPQNGRRSKLILLLKIGGVDLQPPSAGGMVRPCSCPASDRR